MTVAGADQRDLRAPDVAHIQEETAERPQAPLLHPQERLGG